MKHFFIFFAVAEIQTINQMVWTSDIVQQKQKGFEIRTFILYNVS